MKFFAAILSSALLTAIVPSLLFTMAVSQCDANCRRCVPKAGSDVLPALCKSCIGAFAETHLCGPRAQECECHENRRLIEGADPRELHYLPNSVGGVPMGSFYPNLLRKSENATIVINAGPVGFDGVFTNYDCSKLLSEMMGQVVDTNDFFSRCEIAMEVQRLGSRTVTFQDDDNACLGHDKPILLESFVGPTYNNVRAGVSCMDVCQWDTECIYWSFEYASDPQNGGTCQLVYQSDYEKALKGQECGSPPNTAAVVQCESTDTCFYNVSSTVAGKRQCGLNGAGGSACGNSLATPAPELNPTVPTEEKPSGATGIVIPTEFTIVISEGGSDLTVPVDVNTNDDMVTIETSSAAEIETSSDAEAETTSANLKRLFKKWIS